TPSSRAPTSTARTGPPSSSSAIRSRPCPAGRRAPSPPPSRPSPAWLASRCPASRPSPTPASWSRACMKPLSTQVRQTREGSATPAQRVLLRPIRVLMTGGRLYVCPWPPSQQEDGARHRVIAPPCPHLLSSLHGHVGAFGAPAATRVGKKVVDRGEGACSSEFAYLRGTFSSEAEGRED